MYIFRTSGKAMFGDMADTLLSKQISDAIALKVAEYQGTDMTEENFQTRLKELLTAAKAIDPHGVCKQKRTVKIPYRLVEVFCKVVSILQECELNLAALCRECGVHEKTLSLLHFEDSLITTQPIPRLKSCARSLVAKAEVARQNMNTSLRAFESSGTVTIRDVIDKQFKRASPTDPHVAIDAAFLGGMSGETGDNLMQKTLLSELPLEGDKILLPAAHTALQNLISSPLYTFVSETMQGYADSAAGVVSSLKGRTVPEIAKGKVAPLVQECLDRCLFFCSAVCEKKKKVFGKAALVKQFKALEQLMKDSDKAKLELDASLLDDLRIYSWACDDEWELTIRKAEEELRKKHGMDGSAAVEPAASSSSEPSKKKHKASGSASSSSSSLDKTKSKEELLKGTVFSLF